MRSRGVAAIILAFRADDVGSSPTGSMRMNREEVDESCDRCGEELDDECFRVVATREELEAQGQEIPEEYEDREEFPIGTAGYYRTSTGQWAEYADDDEEILCDPCMMNDEDYQADYGNPASI